ncbi:unnamed protein product, partial [Rotaria sordida]
MHPKFISTLRSEQQTLDLYRGQSMTIEEFGRCSAQALISMNTFLSTSEYSIAALSYAGDGTDDSVKSVFFEIEVDTKIDTKPYAYLQENLIQESEREVLFSIGPIFRIDSVEEMKPGKLQHIKLTLSKNETTQIQEMKLQWKQFLNVDKIPLPETAW